MHHAYHQRHFNRLRNKAYSVSISLFPKLHKDMLCKNNNVRYSLSYILKSFDLAIFEIPFQIFIIKKSKRCSISKTKCQQWCTCWHSEWRLEFSSKICQDMGKKTNRLMPSRKFTHYGWEHRRRPKIERRISTKWSFNSIDQVSKITQC